MDQNIGGGQDNFSRIICPNPLQDTGVYFQGYSTSGPSQNLPGQSLNQQVNPDLSQYPAYWQGLSQLQADSQGLIQYPASLQINPEYGSGSTGTDVSLGADLAMQKGNKKPLLETPSAIRSRKHREKKDIAQNEMKMELKNLTEENKSLKAESDNYLNVCRRQEDTLRQEKKAKAELKKKCDDLENHVRSFQRMIMNTENLQKDYLNLKIRFDFLVKNGGKDANEILLKKYGKLKLKNSVLKTKNRALTFQIMKYDEDKKNRNQGEASNQQPVHGFATSIQN